MWENLIGFIDSTAASFLTNIWLRMSHFWNQVGPLRIQKRFHRSRPELEKRRLAALPPELRFLVLQNLPDLASLHNLALASKSFHQVYSNNSHRILRDVLKRDVGGFATLRDAWVAVRASRLQIDHVNQRQIVHDFMTTIGEECGVELILRNLTFNDLIAIARLHKSVRYFASKYISNQLGRKQIPFMKVTPSHVLPPTPDEKRRVNQTLYRLDTLCSLFRDPLHSQRAPLQYTMMNRDEIENWQKACYLPYFYAWEVEAIVCVKEFLEREVESTFPLVQQELSTNPPHLLERAPWKKIPENLPPGFISVSMDRLDWFDVEEDGGIRLSHQNPAYPAISESRVSLGISYLHRLLTADTTKRIKDIFFEDFDDSTLSGTMFLTTALSYRPAILYCDQEAREAFYHQDKETFKGDEDGPNAAWTWANDNKFQAYYNLNRNMHLRAWGYVFWDESRLSDWGILTMDNTNYAAGPQDTYGWSTTEKPESHDNDCIRVPRDQHDVQNSADTGSMDVQTDYSTTGSSTSDVSTSDADKTAPNAAEAGLDGSEEANSELHEDSLAESDTGTST